MIKELRNNAERNERLATIIEGSDFIKGFNEKRLSYDSGGAHLILTVSSDYLTLVETIKEIKKTERELEYRHNFYSCGVMIFTWKSEYINIWFRCKPENIPKELMPSKSCRVEKTESHVEEDYQIVCDL